MKQKLKEKKSMLSSAIRDLTLEISDLKGSKKGIENKLKKTGSNISLTQARETRLRNELATLISDESRLSKKKEKLQQKLTDTKAKLEKVSKISRELEQI